MRNFSLKARIRLYRVRSRYWRTNSLHLLRKKSRLRAINSSLRRDRKCSSLSTSRLKNDTPSCSTTLKTIESAISTSGTSNKAIMMLSQTAVAFKSCGHRGSSLEASEPASYSKHPPWSRLQCRHKKRRQRLWPRAGWSGSSRRESPSSKYSSSS